MEHDSARAHDITWVEVFAEQPLGGNLLPVVTSADDVDDATMATVARRFQQSETSFVQRATDGVSDYRHRIFMVTGEIPFAGHPSLGAAAVVAHRAGQRSASYLQQTGAGRQRLDVVLDGPRGRVTLTQNPAEFGPTPDPRPILDALAIESASLRSDLTAQIVSTGLPTMIVPLGDVGALAGAAVDRDRLRSALAAVAGSVTPTVYIVAEADAGHWRARAFAPAVPTGEDPATGSAAGPFGAYLARHTGAESVVIDQGVEMGSPSRLEVDVTDGIRVSGGVRIVGTGVHEMPAAAG
jgi:trans-2,3-dihydro-3-hydroxyanthranilate isomerase